MAHAALTKRFIDGIKSPESGQAIYWDTKLIGFGLRVTAGSMAFVVQMRVDGKSPRVTLGRYGALTIEQARSLAKVKLADMVQGTNPNEQRRSRKRKTITLDAAYKQYINERELRENTLRDYDKAMRLAFDDWRDLQLVDLNRNLIDERFDELSQPTLNDNGVVKYRNKAFANQAFRFLRALLNWAAEKYCDDQGQPLLPSNPCNRLKVNRKWHKINPRDGWVRPDQMEAFFKALCVNYSHTARQKGVRQLCQVYILTGLRLNEGAALRWSDVDLQRKVITVSAERAKNKNKYGLPIGDWLTSQLKLIKAWLTEAAPDKNSGLG